MSAENSTHILSPYFSTFNQRKFAPVNFQPYWLYLTSAINLLYITCHCDISYLFPISNHNPAPRTASSPSVVSYLFPISNHNFQAYRLQNRAVVSYLFPISNHNLPVVGDVLDKLYLISFLYQTTTLLRSLIIVIRLYLISFLYQTTTQKVCVNLCVKLYLISFLYQTTTRGLQHRDCGELYLISFLYQTTTYASQ